MWNRVEVLDGVVCGDLRDRMIAADVRDQSTIKTSALSLLWHSRSRSVDLHLQNFFVAGGQHPFIRQPRKEVLVFGAFAFVSRASVSVPCCLCGRLFM